MLVHIGRDDESHVFPEKFAAIHRYIQPQPSSTS